MFGNLLGVLVAGGVAGDVDGDALVVDSMTSSAATSELAAAAAAASSEVAVNPTGAETPHGDGMAWGRPRQLLCPLG
ncbi:hypothetical protein V3N99_21850 [Dermatophilaceae bacterium Soc4.6]